MEGYDDLTYMYLELKGDLNMSNDGFKCLLLVIFAILFIIIYRVFISPVVEKFVTSLFD